MTHRVGPTAHTPTGWPDDPSSLAGHDAPFGSAHLARRLQGLQKDWSCSAFCRCTTFSMRLRQPSPVVEWSTLTQRTWATSLTGRNGSTSARTWSSARSWSNCSRNLFRDASTLSVKEFVMENRLRSWRRLCRLPTSTWWDAFAWFINGSSRI